MPGRTKAALILGAFGLLCVSPVSRVRAAPPGAEDAATADPGDPGDPEADPAPGPAPESEQATAPPTTSADPDPENPTAPAGAPTVLDATLPGGLRVLVAEDRSLPVAAVILAVEVGSADDPEGLSGLHAALAYQLQQGNRELRPNAIIDRVHAHGGLAMMAAGSRQVRFESLVPSAFLPRMLALELQRLEAPTVNEIRWRQSLGQARSNQDRQARVPGAVLAAAWDEAGLAARDEGPARALASLPAAEVSARLSRSFEYRRSTLVVVSDLPPEEVLVQVEALAAKMPARPREVPEPTAPTAEAPPGPEASPGPRELVVDGAAGDTFVWPVSGTGAGVFSARVLCGALNRMPRDAESPGRARLRCVMHEDPRRPLLSVRVDRSDDPLADLEAALARLAAPEAEVEVAALLAEQRARQQGALDRASASPLELARLLTRAPPRGAGQGKQRRPLTQLTGAAALAQGGAVPAEAAPLLRIDAALRLVAAPQDGKIRPSAPPRKRIDPLPSTEPPQAGASSGPQGLDEHTPDPDAATPDPEAH